MKRIRKPLVLASLLLIFVTSHCQLALPATNPSAFPSLEDVKSRLLNGTDADRVALATELRLNIPKWTRVGATKDMPCDLFDSVETSYATLLQPGMQAVLHIYSPDCEYTYLAVFDRAANGNWRYVDTMQIWSKYSEPKITLESLVEEGTKEIVAAHCAVDNGTGVTQKNLVIFKLFPDGLRVVFEEPEHVVQQIGAVPKGARSIDQRQDSEFKFIAAAGDGLATSVRQILEKQTLRDHASTLDRWRLYVWNPELRKFQGVPSSPSALMP